MQYQSGQYKDLFFVCFKGPFISWQAYQKMLTNLLIPRRVAERWQDYNGDNDYYDGTPLNWNLALHISLKASLPNILIGPAEQHDRVFYKWPPREPNLTACDIFLWDKSMTQFMNLYYPWL